MPASRVFSACSTYRWAAVLVLVLLVLPTLGRAQAINKYSLEGEWKGPLTVPGGSLPIQIIVTELANGNRFGVLNVVPQRINRIPTSVAQHGDTITFVAEEVGCRFQGVRSADSKRLEGTWSQPGYKAALTLELVPPPPAPPKTFRFPPPYRVQEVTVQNAADRVQLYGTLTIPAGAGPFPAVALLSDWGAQNQDGLYGTYKLLGGLADYLTRRGIAVLRLDDRGVGRSQGATAQAGPEDRVRDAQAALNFLREQPLVDMQHVGLIGHGEGGNVALLTAARPTPPDFVVTLAAAGLPGADVLSTQPGLGLAPSVADTLLNVTRRQQQQLATTRQEQVEKMRAGGSNAAQIQIYLDQQYLRQKAEEKKRLDGLARQQRPLLDVVRQQASDATAQAQLITLLPQITPGLPDSSYVAAAARLTSPWTRSYLNFYPQRELATVLCPVLLLHGADDLVVNAAANQSVLEKGLKGNKQAQVRRLDGLNHLFQAPVTEWPLIDGQPSPVVATVAQDAIRTWIQALVPAARPDTKPPVTPEPGQSAKQ